MRRRVLPVAVAAAVLAALLALGTRPGTEATAAASIAAGPTPMASLRARRHAPAPAARPADDAVEDDADGIETTYAAVVVDVRPMEVGLRTFPKTARLDPATFWPLAGEAPFPEGATADGLQRMLADAPDAPSVPAWVDTALADGLHVADPVDDPWAAVLALEVERRRVALDHRATYDAALAELPPGTLVAAHALVGPPPVDGLVDAADALIDAWPDAPVAEYGRLYLLDALWSAGTDDGATEARALAIDMLRNTDDALVAGQAVSLLTRLPRSEPLARADLDTLEELVGSFPEAVQGIDVAAYALDQALRHGDDARARRWTERLDAALYDRCDAGSPSPWCATHLDNRDEVVALLGDRDPADAETWKQAIEIAAYRCASRLDRAHRGEARWDGGWTWTWPAPDAFTACLERAADAGPVPDAERLQANVTVVF